MARIHWLGSGLSTVPGIRRLIEEGHKVSVWNRTVEKAEAATAGLSGDFDVRAFSMDAFEAALEKGDLAVSMLPGDFHVAVANICLDKGANFVSSSYISPEMKDLDAKAKELGLTAVNEVGLDPGIDHPALGRHSAVGGAGKVLPPSEKSIISNKIAASLD